MESPIDIPAQRVISAPAGCDLNPWGRYRVTPVEVAQNCWARVDERAIECLVDVAPRNPSAASLEEVDPVDISDPDCV